MWRNNRHQGAIIIEERDGQGWALVVAGIGATALGIAMAFAIVQLSSALAWAIGALGFGGGVMLSCKGVAFIIEARGRAKAAQIEAQGLRMLHAARARQLTSGANVRRDVEILEEADVGGSVFHRD